jgi:lipopolysaccharide export system permease protein
MRWVTRYPLTIMATALLFVLASVTSAIWLTQALRFVDLIVNRGLPLSTFLHLAILLLPAFFSLVLPFAMVSAVLFAYNKMVMDSELVVMRAAGVPPLGLARPALLLAALVTAAGYGLSLWLAPLAHGSFKELQFQIRNEYTNVLLREGVFTTIADGLTVYVRARDSSGELLGLLVHDGRDPKNQMTLVAERGALVRAADGPRVVMVNGNRQERDHNGRLSVLYFDRYVMELGLLKQTALFRWREPRERFIDELFFPSDSQIDREHYNKLIAEGHQRIVQPLFALTFTAIGLAALLTGPFSRRGQLGRVLAAVVAVIVVVAVNLGATHLAGRTLSAVPAMYASVLAPTLVAFYLLLRSPRRRAGRALQPAE